MIVNAQLHDTEEEPIVDRITAAYATYMQFIAYVDIILLLFTACAIFLLPPSVEFRFSSAYLRLRTA